MVCRIEYRSMVCRYDVSVPLQKSIFQLSNYYASLHVLKDNKIVRIGKEKFRKNEFYKKCKASNYAVINLWHTLRPNINGMSGGRMTYPSSEKEVRLVF